ncbi:hypothetical protein NDU88_002753 [Pleurodeles waltl]|uniref:Uncharacterized protein n=1 Tax=Pleurodeles waltl TaxID=8319 RepID=A0AAV7RCU4_PLEWA|nr:hypothetical protein NDU88_002753 [Pleurodeles waltl]
MYCDGELIPVHVNIEAGSGQQRSPPGGTLESDTSQHRDVNKNAEEDPKERSEHEEETPDDAEEREEHEESEKHDKERPNVNEGTEDAGNEKEEASRGQTRTVNQEKGEDATRGKEENNTPEWGEAIPKLTRRVGGRRKPRRRKQEGPLGEPA